MVIKSRQIFSRRGDRGETSLLGGDRVQKDDLRVSVYGTLDELQAHLGLARALTRHQSVSRILHCIQQDIIIAASELAASPRYLPSLKRRIGNRHTDRIEAWIDELTDNWGLPTGFVLPGRSVESAAVHVARSVCRRCERSIVTINRMVAGYDQLLIYFNRLSDLLFVIAWFLEVRAVVMEVLSELSAADSVKGKQS